MRFPHRGRVTFLCLSKEKSPKERTPRSLAAQKARGSLRSSRSRALRNSRDRASRATRSDSARLTTPGCAPVLGELLRGKTNSDPEVSYIFSFSIYDLMLT